jgi:hypothetical protein
MLSKKSDDVDMQQKNAVQALSSQPQIHFFDRPPAGDRLRCILCNTRAYLFTSNSVGQIAGHFVEWSRLPTYSASGDRLRCILPNGVMGLPCFDGHVGVDSMEQGDLRHMAASGRRLLQSDPKTPPPNRLSPIHPRPRGTGASYPNLSSLGSCVPRTERMD